MKKVTIAALSIVAATAFSCGSGGGSAVSEPYDISFDVSGIDRSAPFPALSEMVEQIEYVKLEYVPDHPVGDVDGLAVGEENLLIYDNDWGVFHYTRDGRFVRMIGSRGRGPGEYLGIGLMYLDEEAGELHALAFTGSFVVLKFDLATGKFIEASDITEADGSPVKDGTGWGDLVPIGNGLYVSAFGPSFGTVDNLHPDAFLVLDLPAARVIRREASRAYAPSAGATMMLPQPLWGDTEGRVTVFEHGADTMYVVGVDRVLTPRIVARFGNRKMMNPATSEDSGIVVLGAKETGDYILFDLWDGVPLSGDRKSYTMSFDKRTGERALAPENDYPFSGPVNDIDGGFSYLKGGIRGVWWESYDAYRMIETLTDEHFERVRGDVKFPDRMEKLQAFVETLTEDDNPVLAIAKVKK